MRNILIIIGFLIVGCRNGETTIPAPDPKVDSLISLNGKLRDQIKKADSLESVRVDSSFKNLLTSNKDATKYCFVLLSVTQTEQLWGKKEHFYYCTSIQQYSYLDEELKYRLMDDAQASYLGSYSASISRGRVNSRECMVFDTYQEASKAREKYTVSN